MTPNDRKPQAPQSAEHKLVDVIGIWREGHTGEIDGVMIWPKLICLTRHFLWLATVKHDIDATPLKDQASESNQILIDSAALLEVKIIQFDKVISIRAIQEPEERANLQTDYTNTDGKQITERIAFDSSDDREQVVALLQERLQWELTTGKVSFWQAASDPFISIAIFSAGILWYWAINRFGNWTESPHWKSSPLEYVCDYLLIHLPLHVVGIQGISIFYGSFIAWMLL